MLGIMPSESTLAIGAALQRGLYCQQHALRHWQKATRGDILSRCAGYVASISLYSNY